MSNSLDRDQVEKKMFSLIWTQTVCKGYQQMTEVSKVVHMSMKVLCIGSHYMLKQQPIRIAMPYANSSFTKRCSHWFISDSATESLSKHCGHTGMPDS